MADGYYPIKHSRHRPVTLILWAAADDQGPYFLTDRAMFGVSWRKPAIQHLTVGKASARHGAAFVRRETWIPTFDRARLAFELCELDETVTPKEAKAAADWTADHLGRAGTETPVVALAFERLEKIRARSKRAR